MIYDKKLTEIINRVSNRNSIEASVTKDAIEHFFNQMSDQIKNKGKDILIHNFGTFSKNKGKLLKPINENYYNNLPEEKKEIISKMIENVKNSKPRTRSDAAKLRETLGRKKQ